MSTLHSLLNRIHPVMPIRNGVALLPILLLAISVIIAYVIRPFPRIFSPTDPSISFPLTDPETIPNLALFAICTVYPTIILLLRAWHSRFSFHHIIYSLNALYIALTWTMVITNFLKVTIGSLRPDFLARCKPVQNPSALGGWQCTGDPDLVDQGRLSFPSGHSSMSFSGGSFLILFLYGTLATETRRNVWMRTLLMVLIVPAFLSAISRLCDYRHRPEDVISGALIGIAMSWYWYDTHFTSPKHGNEPKQSGPIGAPLLSWTRVAGDESNLPEYEGHDRDDLEHQTA